MIREFNAASEVNCRSLHYHCAVITVVSYLSMRRITYQHLILPINSNKAIQSNQTYSNENSGSFRLNFYHHIPTCILIVVNICKLIPTSTSDHSYSLHSERDEYHRPTQILATVVDPCGITMVPISPYSIYAGRWMSTFPSKDRE